MFTSSRVGLLVALAALGTAGRGLAQTAPAAGAIDFNRDVRPILANHCFKCHGPDDQNRQAGLRLDHRERATAEADSGEIPIVPGKPDESQLIQRIYSTDKSEMMPPPETRKPLSDGQRATLKAWIAAGAEYRDHWSFVAPKQAPLPVVRRGEWCRNPIDHFVLAKQEAAGLTPAAEADRYTLCRRLFLDLIGIPPSAAELERFVSDTSPDAYDRLVDALLASPHYGERWARRWLDLARYADTNGYEKDRVRSIWPYRDWVIKALNADMPFDRFTIEQLAGDMLPEATPEQQVATGFLRNSMINEEGGIDPLEFRFYSMNDRVTTTGTAWMGLTLECSRCHTHKYDPIPQREYYQLMALMDNADEPAIPVIDPQITARRAEMAQKIAGLKKSLADKFPAQEEYQWHTPRPSEATSQAGATSLVLDDASVRFSGTESDKDTYTWTVKTDIPRVAALRLETLTDLALPETGPGRGAKGSFVLSEITASVAPSDTPEKPQAVRIARAEADAARSGFPAENAIDGKRNTGWGVESSGPGNSNHTATFYFAEPVPQTGRVRWTIQLVQDHGARDTLGRVRISLGQAEANPTPIEERRRDNLHEKFTGWLAGERPRATRWSILHPLSAKANVPLLKVLDDESILAASDQTKHDTYDLKFAAPLRRITALRIEALPHESLPEGGPGRTYYEGSFGDFFLTNMVIKADGRPVAISAGSQSFAAGGDTADKVFDSDMQSGWSINGGQGRAHRAVFQLAEPLAAAHDLDIELSCERYYASDLGRFRISVTDAPSATAQAWPAEIESLLLIPDEVLRPEERSQLRDYYLSVAPELAGPRAEIAKLESQLPKFPTTLVMTERPADIPRVTRFHQRGEFLRPTEAVQPDVPSFLPRLPEKTPHNRLALARWLVDGKHPLTGRVTMNRQWAAFFGRGIVRTTEDFGVQGEPPSHPELLDWLAVELVNRGWSLKKMHRLIVTSATYRQSSNVTPDLLQKDPQNKLLSHAPRARLEAELIRDAVLKVSELLSDKLGGPSVFPPQPPGVSTEGTFGGLTWNVSQGADRYRRGLYTFAKRTAPYAMFSTFDAPSGEACVARREVSNTPLQALTMLNDTVLIEASQAIGKQVARETGESQERIDRLVLRCLSRPVGDAERKLLVDYYQRQRQRLAAGELPAETLAGEKADDAIDRAAWAMVARVLLNLDEFVSKN